MKKLLCLILFLIALFESKAQKALVYHFENAKDSTFFIKNINPPQTASDSANALQILRGSVLTLHRQAFLEASVDSFVAIDTFFHAYIRVGARYEWAHLRNGNVSDAFLAQVGFREKLFENKAFIYSEIADIEYKLLTYAEDNGYPFAQVWLDSLQINEGKLSAALMMQTGEVFRFDTLNTEGLARVSPKFLQNYLSLKKGELFNRSKVLSISQRIAELPFLQERKKPLVKFLEDRTAVLYLFLDPKKASKWDFLVGVLPNTTPSGDQKFTVTFNGNVDFHNLLGLGERIFANFENLRPESPRVNLKLAYPYILNLPFGFDGSFDLYKRDSAYLETNLNLGAQYLLGGNDYLKLFWNQYSSNNLIINKLQVISNKKLPNTLDVETNTIGLEFSKQRLDYRFNPRRGWSVLLRGGAGVREVRKNADILNLKDPNDATYNFAKLYDTVSVKSFQYVVDSKLEYYIPFLKRAALKIGMTSGLKFTSAPISLNEQYRIGGNKILRGFDEESVFATRYVIGTLEYRLLIGRNSYLYLFGDAGYIENVTRTAQGYDQPLGFGAGITFETGVGLFGVSLAVGKQQDNAFDFRNIKTHFGYVSLF
jgi:outer membrane protein assembly factor BamA